jgi:septal ring factor EnvC (AmiA/AmiB activator)
MIRLKLAKEMTFEKFFKDNFITPDETLINFLNIALKEEEIQVEKEKQMQQEISNNEEKMESELKKREEEINKLNSKIDQLKKELAVNYIRLSIIS